MKNLLAWHFMALHVHVGISQGRNNIIEKLTKRAKTKNNSITH